MTTTRHTTEPFPVDWHAWRAVWLAWRDEHAAQMRSTGSRWPGRNMLADELLGTWRIGDRYVELSEVTFPDLSGQRRGERVRYVGVTMAAVDDVEHSTAELAENIDALDRLLGFAS